MPRRVLVVDDNAVFARQLVRSLEARGIETIWLTHGSQVPAALEERECDVAVVEAVMPGLGGGRLVDYLRAHSARMGVFVVAASASLATAIEVMKKGALDYLVKPISQEVLAEMVREVLDESAEAGASDDAAQRGEPELVGECPAIRDIFRVIDKVALSDAPVLILGESGTGKELVARAVHRRSRRAGALFLAVNCGALAAGVLESELFGHVRGAFTGARWARRGLFEEADGGAIFLDEIASTALGFQAKLLRVLEDGMVRPVGATASVRTDVRILAAANVDLTAAVRAGRFRDDLFYRLNVVRLELPPLRERLADLDLLVRHFSTRAARDLERTPPEVAPEFLAALRRHDWPGNVRELRNAVERAVLVSDSGVLRPEHLPSEITAADGERRALRPYREAKQRAMSRFRRDYIRRLLDRHQGNISRAARAAGIPRQTLHRLIREAAAAEPDV